MVRPVRTRKDLSRFIGFPYRLHARDPNWVPPLRRDVRTLLSPAANPFFRHADAEYYLAERNGSVVGRIAAIANRLHNETHADRVGFFGFLELVNDQEVADALLDTAAAWLRDRGFATMRGPASFSVNDECGLLVEGFDTPPTLMMPHNPPYYLPLLEAAGFRKVKDLLAYEGGYGQTDFAQALDRLERGSRLVQERQGITIRALRMSEFEAEVERVKLLYNLAWERNWGFVPMTGEEIDHLAKQFKPVVVPDLVPFAEKDGTPVGFALGLPDFNYVFRRHRSGRMLPAALHLLWALRTRRIPRARVLLLGVDPAYRGRGVDAMLYHWFWKRGAELGITWGEAGWVLEDNASMNAGLRKMGWTWYKTYRLLDRPL